MRIDGVTLRRVRLPLVTPFRTSFGTETERDVLLVAVHAGGITGWGECVAMTEPLYSSEWTDGAHAVTRAHLLPRLAAAASDVTAAEVAPLLSAVKGHRMAKAAVEMAVLDAELQGAGRSLAAELGSVRDRVPAGVSVGIPGSVADLLAVVGAHLAEGYVRIKLKIEPGWDVEPVAAVRDRFGPDVALQVDANAAYTLDDSATLARLDRYGLLLIEQPLAEDDLAGHAELARRIATPVCLDESITSAAAAREAIERGACSVVNIKAGRVGGYLGARAVHDTCRAAGVAVWCGGMLETGLGRAANVALAGMAGFTLPGDLSASDRYFHRDLTEPFVLDAGHLAVPAGPGLGRSPRPDVMAEVTTAVEDYSVSGGRLVAPE